MNPGFELANMTGGQFDQYYNNRAPGLPASFTVLVFPEVLQGVWQAFQVCLNCGSCILVVPLLS